ncbi:diguanylate cyclase (GGDEF)-like protein [Paucimonas lemoignei]|uniref:diguanylate cyclase n=1 Tax=Paucimonas lemoignei TaxID=29443 RepID=A0A4R3HW56_PAULE|nr:GGDEF domain-containing protein [Paucimonas lemoignei]TCS37507.1 diguanylate cyclase (GGDEF)-like protein [Paucimonas lemoignei]
MPSAKQAFLIGALFCLLSFLVILALQTRRVRGVNQILAATVLGIGGNLLYAFGRELPPLIAYEMANGVYAAASATLFVAYRYFFTRRPFSLALTIAVPALMAAIAFFHYVHDSFLARSVIVSLFQIGIAGGIAVTLLQSRAQWHKPYYTECFILTMCSLVSLGHLARMGWMLVAPQPPASLLQSEDGSVILMSAAAVALPALAFGGLLLAHRRIISMVEYAANHDFLTGALSRKGFFEISERELARAVRHHRPLALLLIDFDNFKPVNDTYGHDAGDRTLMLFSRFAKEQLRAVDCLGRMGGDEFAILLPETELPGAVAVANKLSKKIKAGMTGKEHAGLTVSIGVAVRADGDSLQTLIKRADEALYEAKDNGRDRVASNPRLPADACLHSA